MAHPVGTFDPEKAAEAQQLNCNVRGVPDFTPKNSKCFSCKKNIYQPQYFKKGEGYKLLPGTPEDFILVRGFSVEAAGNSHITGCPHCNKSFCD